MRLVLDTNAYSALLESRGDIREILESADEIIVPAAVCAELEFGFLKGTRYQENKRRLSEFLSIDGVKFQPATKDIAERWGFVKAALQKAGHPIPDNDIWIASTALELGARVLSFDKHFDFVPGIIRLE